MITREEWLAAGNRAERYDVYLAAHYIAERMDWTVRGWDEPDPGASFYCFREPCSHGVIHIDTSKALFNFRDRLKALELESWNTGRKDGIEQADRWRR